MLNRFKKMNKGTKTAVLCAFVLTVIVLSKVGIDVSHSYQEWRKESIRVAKVEEEQRALAEAEVRKLKQEVDKTIIVLNETLASIKSSKNPSDWVSKFQDAWDHDVVIVKKGSRNGWEVISSGPDGELNTFDDIKREESNFSFSGYFLGGKDQEIKSEVVEPEPEVKTETKKWWSWK